MARIPPSPALSSPVLIYTLELGTWKSNINGGSTANQKICEFVTWQGSLLIDYFLLGILPYGQLP